MNRILRLDPVQRMAVVEPGVINLNVTKAAAPCGLLYAPDPSSQTVCKIGGNVAFNNGVAHCLKYGMTSMHVLGLKVVLPDGSIDQLDGDSLENIQPDYVGMLVGCVQQVIAPESNAATIRVLAQNGFDVIVPRGQGCCGSMSMHTGDAKSARNFAKVNLDLFPENLQAIITNAAGSGMKEYELLFCGHPLEEKAARFTNRVQDISQFLSSIDLVPPKSLAQSVRVA